MNYIKKYYDINNKTDSYNLFTPFLDMNGVEIRINDRVCYKDKKGNSKYIVVTGLFIKAIKRNKYDYNPYSVKESVFMSKHITGSSKGNPPVSLWRLDRVKVIFS